MGFTLGLGWHLSEKYFPKESSELLLADEPNQFVSVSEDKEPTPEERVKLPEITPEELSFRQHANQVLKSFPDKAILKEQHRDLHAPPPELREVGAELGAIEELLDKDPSLTKEGLRFYRKCALKESLLTSVRALCLHNLKTRAKATGLYPRIRWGEFPDNLHRIADKL